MLILSFQITIIDSGKQSLAQYVKLRCRVCMKEIYSKYNKSDLQNGSSSNKKKKKDVDEKKRMFMRTLYHKIDQILEEVKKEIPLEAINDRRPNEEVPGPLIYISSIVGL